MEPITYDEEDDSLTDSSPSYEDKGDLPEASPTDDTYTHISLAQASLMYIVKQNDLTWSPQQHTNRR